MTIGESVSVSKSLLPGAGLGLFAAQAFKKNTYITMYSGESITFAEARKRRVQTHMATREGVIIDGVRKPIEGIGGGSFANGSPLFKNSNAKIVGQLGNLIVRSTRSIESGEEIIIHYGRRGFQIACGHARISH